MEVKNRKDAEALIGCYGQVIPDLFYSEWTGKEFLIGGIEWQKLYGAEMSEWYAVAHTFHGPKKHRVETLIPFSSLELMYDPMVKA